MPAILWKGRNDGSRLSLLPKEKNDSSGGGGSNRKWGNGGGRGIMKRIFRRSNNKHEPMDVASSTVVARSVESSTRNHRQHTVNKDGSGVFAMEELDQTTVNLSRSGGSNPYSTDESYEAETYSRSLSSSSSPQRHSKSFALSKSSSYGTSVNQQQSNHTGSRTSINDDRTENSFVQLDVQNMQRISSKLSQQQSPNRNGFGTPIRNLFGTENNNSSHWDETSVTFDDGENITAVPSPFNEDAIPFVFHTRSTTSAKVLEDTYPVIGSSSSVTSSAMDHHGNGTEVILFEYDDNNEAEINGVDEELEFDDKNDIFMSFKSTTKDDVDIDEDDVWRDPFKDSIIEEIAFPFTKATMNASNRNDATTTTPPRINREIDQQKVPPSPAESIRSEISHVTWVSHDDDDLRPVKEIVFDHPIPSLFNHSFDTNESETKAAESRHLPSPSIEQQKAPSSAERLLIAMTASVDGSETKDDHLDHDAANDATNRSSHSADLMQTISTTQSSPNDMAASTNMAVRTELVNTSFSYHEATVLQGLVRSRTQSTEMFSKAISDNDDEADDEGEDELTNNASASYTASSYTSYGALSTIQDGDGSDSRQGSQVLNGGRRNGTGKNKLQQHRRHRSLTHIPYCGVFIQEDVEEDDEEDYDNDDEEDDLTLRSEDFSVRRTTNSHANHNVVTPSSSVTSSSFRRNNSSNRLYRSRSSHAIRRNMSSSSSRREDDEAPLLDQVRNEFYETVQDLAREGSSVVMNFLRSRS